jgi:hypothetical protein
VRVLACVLALAALAAAGTGGATHAAACPTATFRGATITARCTPTGGGPLRSAQGRIATIHAVSSEETIEVDGKPVLRMHEDRSKVPGGVPGPLGLVMWSPDGRWLFYFIDPFGSDSYAADGLVLRALDVSTGKSIPVGRGLLSADYRTWCGSTLVLTLGGNRIATDNKRLEVARAPGWKPHLLWKAPARAFGSLDCAPDGKSVVVQAQHESTDAHFFAPRWQLWRVGLDGSHTLLDAPPAGFADESPVWSPGGTAVAFVRERKGYGSLEVLQNGHVFGPLATLGYSLGYYGHHDWDVAWRA